MSARIDIGSPSPCYTPKTAQKRVQIGIFQPTQQNCKNRSISRSQNWYADIAIWRSLEAQNHNVGKFRMVTILIKFGLLMQN